MDSGSLQNHYHQPNLTESILNALAKAGVDIENLTRADLDMLDEFHIRGKAATLELAALAQLKEGHKVLDLGCGIGGPARHLADEHGCTVVGLDLVSSYCDAAVELTARVGLDHLVSFQQGDMTEMPFEDDSFDYVWSQHTWMNISNKAGLATEIRRVLGPGGKALVYEVCEGSGVPIDLPVPWASVPEHSFLCTETELRECFSGAGFQEKSWENVTDICLNWIEGLTAAIKTKAVDTSPRPGLGLLMGANAGIKGQNMLRNLVEGKIVVVRGILSTD